MESLEKKNNDVLVVFDFDGTIADTGPIINETFKYIFAKYMPHIELSEAELTSFMGPTLHETFIKYADESEIEKLIMAYIEYNLNLQKKSLNEIDNATNLLKKLKNNNVSLGVVSSKRRDSLMLGIELLEFSEYLDVIVGGDEVSIPKPNPEGILKAEEKLNKDFTYKYYVGDIATDVIAAKASGFSSIAILTNKLIKDSIEAANPDYIINDLLEILDIIEEDLNGKI